MVDEASEIVPVSIFSVDAFALPTVVGLCCEMYVTSDGVMAGVVGVTYVLPAYGHRYMQWYH